MIGQHVVRKGAFVAGLRLAACTTTAIAHLALLPSVSLAQQIRNWEPESLAADSTTGNSRRALQACASASALCTGPTAFSARITNHQKESVILGAVVGSLVLGLPALLAGSVFDNIVNDQGEWNFGPHAAIGGVAGGLLGAALGALIGWHAADPGPAPPGPEPAPPHRP